MERFPVVMATGGVWQRQQNPRTDQQTLVSRRLRNEQVGFALNTTEIHPVSWYKYATRYYNKKAVLSRGTTARCGALVQKACT